MLCHQPTSLTLAIRIRILSLFISPWVKDLPLKPIGPGLTQCCVEVNREDGFCRAPLTSWLLWHTLWHIYAITHTHTHTALLPRVPTHILFWSQHQVYDLSDYLRQVPVWMRLLRLTPSHSLRTTCGFEDLLLGHITCPTTRGISAWNDHVKSCNSWRETKRFKAFPEFSKHAPCQFFSWSCLPACAVSEGCTRWALYPTGIRALLWKEPDFASEWLSWLSFAYTTFVVDLCCFCRSRDQTWGLSHARSELFNWASPRVYPALNFWDGNLTWRPGCSQTCDLPASASPGLL